MRNSAWAIYSAARATPRKAAAACLASRTAPCAPEPLQLASRGSGAQTYQQRITLNHYGQGWGVSGKCSCPVGFNCKHVASALLTLQSQQEQGVDLSPLIAARSIDFELDASAAPVPVHTS